MKLRTLFLFLVFALIAPEGFAQFNYPVARKVAFDTTIFGVQLGDPYFWMSKAENQEEVLEFCKQQTALSQAQLDSVPGIESLQQDIDEAMMSLQDEIWNVNVVDSAFYYYRDIPDEGPTLCRRKSLNAPEEKILKRVIIKGQSYSIRKRVFAFKKPLVALMLTQNGEANPQIRIYHLDRKEFLPDSIAPVMFNDSRGVSMAWSPDDNGLLYTQAPPTTVHAEKYYSGKIILHKVGTSQSEDVPVFGIGLNDAVKLDARETPYIYSFGNSPYLVARIRSGSDENYAFAVHMSELDGANTPWKKLEDYVNLGDGFDANGKYLYAATTGQSNYRIVKVDMETGAPPVEFLPAQEKPFAVSDYSHRSAIVVGKNVMYLLMRKIGDMQIIRVDLETKKISYLPVDRNSTLSKMQLVNDNDMIYGQSSPIRSELFKIYRYSSNSIEGLPFADKFADRSDKLKTEVIYVPSRDGKKIPVSLVYSSSLSLKNNNRPFLIDAYGNSGASEDLFMNPGFDPWINRGGVYAYAHVRGGGELGEDWYKDGQFPNKMNSVNDVVDVADWLTKNQYTTPSKVLVMGGSAGSFLVGGAVNQRPDLFAGGIYLAGLPDLATHTDAAAAREEKSIGPKNTEEGFLSNYNLSAIYHIPDGKHLPAMLIIHGATDYILSMHPVARYTATLQEKQKGDRPILMMVDWAGGHRASNDEIFFVLKFALWQTGHPDFQPN